MIGAVEKQKLVYILNRDGRAANARESDFAKALSCFSAADREALATKLSNLLSSPVAEARKTFDAAQEAAVHFAALSRSSASRASSPPSTSRTSSSSRRRRAWCPASPTSA